MSMETLAEKLNELVPDQGIYRLTQTLFDSIHQFVPEQLQNIPIEVMLYAGLGGYGLTWALQLASKNIVDRIIPGFDKNALPIFERACEFGIPAAALLYAIADPDGFVYWAYNKGLDNVGMVSAYLTGVLAAEQHLQSKQPEKDPQIFTPKIKSSNNHF